jgi:predicted GNAT family acetyltransferase
MIVKLTDKHKEELLQLVLKEKELNLFIIADIENYGFDKEFLEFWGELNEDLKITAVLMRYYEDFVVYSRGEYDVLGFSKIVNSIKFRMLSGEKSTIEKFSNFVDVKEKQDTYFAKLEDGHNLYNGESINSVVKTELEDINKVWELQNKKIAEFTDLSPVQRMKGRYIDKTARGYHIKNDKNEIVSSVETGGENASSAMVLGVCTDPNYRGHGYAAAITSKLCKVLLSEGKSPCLFYYNPKAGEIYKRLGFKDIGMWSMWIS